MVEVPDFNKIQEKLALDFERLEEIAGVSFKPAARNRIQEMGAWFIFKAHLLKSYSSFDARKSRSMARKILKAAINTKPRLRTLWALLDDSFMHDLALFVGFENIESIDLLEKAIALVDEIAKKAKSSSAEPRRGGRPERRDFKILVRGLFRVYLNAGGKGKVRYDKRKKLYVGDALYFVRAVVIQIKPFIPLEVFRKIMPVGNKALIREIYAALRGFPPTGK